MKSIMPVLINSLGTENLGKWKVNQITDKSGVLSVESPGLGRTDITI